MKHTVYTRCKYGLDNQVRERLRLSLTTVIPCMVGQVGARPFKWTWLCFERHEEMIREALQQGGWTGEVGFNEMKVTAYREVDFSARLGIRMRNGDEQIQTALDSDDLIHQHWIREIQRFYRPSKKPTIVYWHPHRFVLSTEKWYRPVKLASWPSMFYSIYNPTDSVHIYCKKHNQMGLLGVPCHADAREGFCALTLHTTNLHTTLKKTDREISAPEGFR